MQLEPSAEPIAQRLSAKVVHRTEQCQEISGSASIHPGAATPYHSATVTTTARITPEGGIEALASIVLAPQLEVPTVETVARDISALSLNVQSETNIDNIDNYETPPLIPCSRPILTNISDQITPSSRSSFPKPHTNIDGYETPPASPFIRSTDRMFRVPATSKSKTGLRGTAESDQFYECDNLKRQDPVQGTSQAGLARSHRSAIGVSRSIPFSVIPPTFTTVPSERDKAGQHPGTSTQPGLAQSRRSAITPLSTPPSPSVAGTVSSERDKAGQRPGTSSQPGLARSHRSAITSRSTPSSPSVARTVFSEQSAQRPLVICSPAWHPSGINRPRIVRKWYVVTVGRRTGVFYNWGYVSRLVNHISGNNHISFMDEQEAYDYYNEQKAAGLVEVRRNPGDDDSEFGPAESAIQ